jgi:hypothetical protein
MGKCQDMKVLQVLLLAGFLANEAQDQGKRIWIHLKWAGCVAKEQKCE